MLILSRRIGETLVVGDNVKITILSVKGNQIRIGVEAPKEISIKRGELDEDKFKKNENK
ncbi:MAG: carbon storage regulator CsrA [Succinivibrionaceae bacterium]|nr:carbon storage regulator CsrA [Ruminobacter sp.]MDY5779536.1 carbon storage regulator CsrA [Succinivibrionaceae bacterium]MEE1340634.1 carbon storage regulator CsrA [Succinivibrionaceae bacterium]